MEAEKRDPGNEVAVEKSHFRQPEHFCTLAGVTQTSHALGEIPAFHDGAGARFGNPGPFGGTAESTVWVYDEKLEARA